MERDVACLIITNEFGEILLQKKDMRFPPWPGYWSMFGGGIKDGESPEAAIKRESQQEIGLDLDMEFFKAFPYDEGERSGTMHVFTAKLKSEAIIDIRCGEGAGFAWLTQEEIESYKAKIIPQDLAILQEFMKTSSSTAVS